MAFFDQTTDEQINFRVREIESVLGYVKTHLASGAKTKAAKEADNLEQQIWKLKELLKA